ncbi:MAG: Clp protease N-terminal domain-containing protein [Aggregatilineales bacterium]
MTIYSRYSHHARRALTHASLLTQRYRHPRVDTGHLLVGVLLTRGSIGATLLTELSLEADFAEPKLADLTLPIDDLQEDPPNDAALDFALELAADESNWLGHHYIGTQHLLLGITRTNLGNAADLLRLMDIQPDQVRRRVRASLNEGLQEFSLDTLRRTANLSELSRRVLTAAEQLAVAHDHQMIGLGHLLLVISRERRSTMSSLLLQVGLNDVAVTRGLEQRDDDLMTSIEQVIPPAVELSRSLGSHYTGTEHFLLALTEDDTGAEILRRLGVNVRQLHDHIKRRLTRG